MRNVRLVMTDSGDWYLVEDGYEYQFYEDELEEEVDESKFVYYVGNPEDVLIKSYEIQKQV